MAKFTSLDDFELLPHPDYINRFTSGKDLLIDLFGEEFYLFLKLHIQDYSTPQMWKKVNQICFYKYLTTYHKVLSTWGFIKNYFNAYLVCRNKGHLSEYLKKNG